MAFCAQCGAQSDGDFCAACGARAGAPPPAVTGTVLEDHIVNTLCYFFMPLTGVLFLVMIPLVLLMKRPQQGGGPVSAH